VLFNEPKLLKYRSSSPICRTTRVSVLFNEPKLLKSSVNVLPQRRLDRFSALQRAEIAEIIRIRCIRSHVGCFSALQRAEIAEIVPQIAMRSSAASFSALQRAEIAEIDDADSDALFPSEVSVLFNEPKLLKCSSIRITPPAVFTFQCSSTSRNC